MRRCLHCYGAAAYAVWIKASELPWEDGASMLPPQPPHVPELCMCTTVYVQLSMSRRSEAFHLAGGRMEMFSSSRTPKLQPLSATFCRAATGQSPGASWMDPRKLGKMGSEPKEFPSWFNQEPSFSRSQGPFHTEQSQGSLPERGRGTSGVMECLPTVPTVSYTGDRDIGKLHGCCPFPPFPASVAPCEMGCHGLKREHEDCHQ